MTKIEWTEATWNPIVGCTVLSPGCTHCYAMKTAHRMSHNLKTPQYHGTTKVVNGKPVWTGKVSFVESVLMQPLKRKKPTTYFVNSMGDLFHEDVPVEWIDKVFAIMALCPQHIFQVLTKRADRMREYFTQDDGFGRWGYIEGYAKRLAREELGISAKTLSKKTLCMMSKTNLPHVWLGVSVEDQRRADERIPMLLETTAAVRFISAEPLLGAMDLTKFLRPGCDRCPPWEVPCRTGCLIFTRLNWVICGGESGPDARPMHPDWARSLRDQCQAAGVTFFFKQWGAWLPSNQECPASLDGNPASSLIEFDWADAAERGIIHEFSKEIASIRVKKSQAGRLLDGREWNEVPSRIDGDNQGDTPAGQRPLQSGDPG